MIGQIEITEKLSSPLSGSRILARAAQQYGTVSVVKHNEVFCAQGDPAEAIFFIEDGFAVSKKLLRDGRQLITGISVPGDIINDEAFTIGAVFSTIYAIGETKLLKIALKDFKLLISGDPIYQQLFLRHVAFQGRLAKEWLVRVGRLTATEKTAHFACEMFWRLDLVGYTDDNFCSFALRQQEWADILGVSLVQQNRSLSELRGQGLVKWSSKGFHIMDREALEKFANFDSGYLAAAFPTELDEGNC